MTEPAEQYPEVTAHLRELGHSDTEIAKILARVQQYEVANQVDSVMDSIDAGQIDLAAIIQQALAEDDAK